MTTPDWLRPKPPKRVKAWLDEHARFEERDGQWGVSYTARVDLVPPDVQRWVDKMADLARKEP